MIGARGKTLMSKNVTKSCLKDSLDRLGGTVYEIVSDLSLACAFCSIQKR